MEPEARYAFIGTFVIGLIAALIISIAWLSKTGQKTATKNYVIYFKNFSLSGLQINSLVTMKGIQIGAVKNLKITSDDQSIVRVLIEVQKDLPVGDGTQAVIQRNLLTGLAMIDLTKASKDPSALIKKPGEPYPIIPEGQTPLGAIQDSLPQLIERTAELLNRANNFLRPENEETFRKILTNVERITGSFKINSKDLAQLLKDISELIKDTRKFINNLDSKSQEISSTISHSSEQINQEIANISRDLSLAIQTLNAVLERFENPRAILTGPEKSTLGPGEKQP